jgi:hypothetical protein
VIAVYRDSALGGYCHATIIMIGGEEITGLRLALAVTPLQAKL